MASIRFIEESDYGQDVLRLLRVVSYLMDKDKTYTDKEIDCALSGVRVQTKIIQHKMSGKKKMSYFEGSS